VRSTRQACTALFVADVVLFLVASTFNDHSSTSVDGILWWIALFVFVLLIALGSVVFVQYLRSRRKRPRRA
jgi:hypothetical protein